MEHQEVDYIGGYVTLAQLWMHIENLVQIMYTMQWNMMSYPCGPYGECAPGVRCRCGCVIFPPPANHAPAQGQALEMRAGPSMRPASGNTDAPAVQESWSTPRRSARLAKVQVPQRQTQNSPIGWQLLADDSSDAEEPPDDEAPSGAAASLPPSSSSFAQKRNHIKQAEIVSDDDILNQAIAEAQAEMHQPVSTEMPSVVGGSAAGSFSMQEVESSAGTVSCFESRSGALERHRSISAGQASAAETSGGHTSDEHAAGVAARHGHCDENQPNASGAMQRSDGPVNQGSEWRELRKQQLAKEFDRLAGRLQ